MRHMARIASRARLHSSTMTPALLWLRVSTGFLCLMTVTALFITHDAQSAAAPLPSGVQTDLPCMFESETVSLKIEEKRVVIRASYFFGHIRPRDACLFSLPFLADSTMGRPALSSAAVGCGEDSSAVIRVNHRQEPWLLRIQSEASDTCRLNLEWSQDLHAPRAGYLLTTAMTWPEPLRRIRLEVTYPRAMPPPRFTYPLAAESTANEWVRYSWTANDFMPDHDLVVSWATP
jgi:hypothetical protein